ncbi:MAG: S1C family serine protease [Planctomycetota bacterium]
MSIVRSSRRASSGKVGSAAGAAVLVVAGVLAGRATAPPPATARELPATFADVVARANPSVVHVAIRHDDGVRRASRDDGVGGGFVVRAGGYVVTSRHVLAGAREIFVTAPGSGPHVAQLVGVDDATDTALLRVPQLADRLPLPPADLRGLRIGDVVLAAGSPFALPNSWSLGLVSGLGRSGLGVNPRGYESFIQTDAAANLGSSGGPLLDADGRVVGVMTAILSRGGTHQGVSLATPIDAVFSAVARLLGERGPGRRDGPAPLGLSVRPLAGQGLVVTRIDVGGAAERAGLRPGDVLTHVGSTPLTEAATLQEQAWQLPPGGSLVLSYLRDNRRDRVVLIPSPR